MSGEAARCTRRLTCYLCGNPAERLQPRSGIIHQDGYVLPKRNGLTTVPHLSHMIALPYTPRRVAGFTVPHPGHVAAMDALPI